MLGVLLWVQHLFRAPPLPFQALLCIQTPLHAVSEGGCVTDSLWPLPLRWRREEMMRSAGLRWAMSSSVQRGSGMDSVTSLCWTWQSSLQDPLWLPQQTLATPAHPPAHRPGRVYLKQASAEVTKGGLKMVRAG